jgi:peptidoglycan/xylan/chitin deacetylase (PgdA/CDA1 family)
MNRGRFGERPTRVRSAAAWTAARLAAGLQHAYGNCRADGFTILMYHRVADGVPGVEPPTCNVSPDRLRRQLSGLLARGFQAWPLSRLAAAQRESQKVPSHVFAITFDDGYENNYLNAWPILRELQVPATIFLTTKYLDTDQPFPFDDWSATGSSCVPASTWRPLTTAQCQEMSASGLIELGAHTHSHGRFLGRCNDFHSDLKQCLDVLRDRFGLLNPAFAFPYGDTGPELIEIAKRLPVACCVTTRHRRVETGDDIYDFGRFSVSDTDTAMMLAAKITGWYTRVVTGAKNVTGSFGTMMRMSRAAGATQQLKSQIVNSRRSLES